MYNIMFLSLHVSFSKYILITKEIYGYKKWIIPPPQPLPPLPILSGCFVNLLRCLYFPEPQYTSVRVNILVIKLYLSRRVDHTVMVSGRKNNMANPWKQNTPCQHRKEGKPHHHNMMMGYLKLNLCEYQWKLALPLINKKNLCIKLVLN